MYEEQALTGLAEVSYVGPLITLAHTDPRASAAVGMDDLKILMAHRLRAEPLFLHIFNLIAPTL